MVVTWDDDDEARVPFVAPTSNSSNKDGSTNSNSSSIKKGLICNRILIISTLVLLVIVSIYFQWESITLSNQLKIDESTISDLQSKLDAQNAVIQRFNNTVTNSDVLSKLEQMEQNLKDTKDNLVEQLSTTNRIVEEKLNHTLQTLDETVTAAESKIYNEVDIVQKNFEQYALQTENQFSMENSFMVYQLAGTFTLLSCLISMWHMTAHMRKLRQPVIQRKILAILWMSPIYAITSWFSLVFHPAEGYLAIIKDAYEAYVIYQFLSFCISVLGKGDRNTVVDLLAKHADHLTPPFRLFPCFKRDPYDNDRQLADEVLFQCQYFAMQFVFLRPLTTIANVILNQTQYYGPWGATGPNDYRAPQFYVVLIQNLSIFTAFTGLLKFYHAVDKELAWCRPFAKFLCIKGVVFMTFWQGLAISVLAETTDVGGASAEEWAKSAQNFLICLEMLCFSIAHFYCFPTDEWEPNYKALHKKAGLGDSIAFGDFVDDLKLFKRAMLKSSSSSNKKKSKKKKKPSEPTVPEEGEEGEDGDDSTADNNNVEVEYRDDSFDETDDTTIGTSSSAVSSLCGSETGGGSGSDTIPELQEVGQRLLHSDFLNDDEEDGRTTTTRNTTTTDNVETANEQTSLLSSSSSRSENEEVLRPSIFTSIGSSMDKNQK